jgi:inner membrane protein
LDPVTHALLGGAVARVALSRPLGHAAWIPGAVGALLPDADAFIRSAADPLLYAEYHRHFTHSLTFIPIGGAVAALPWMLRPTTRPQWRSYLAAATLGYATHGVLDASTTWGTRLLWPFSDLRVAWNWIAIVDPVFTMLLLAGVASALWRRSAAFAAVALLLCAAYVAAGAVQRERALIVQSRLALARGHETDRREVFPGFGNNLIWRSLYSSGGRLYMDRIRVPPFGVPSWSPGTSVEAFDESTSAGAGNAERRRDLRRFAHFSSGWLARAQDDPDIIGDARYSMSTHEYVPVWGIRFDERTSRAPQVSWVDRSSQRRVDLWDALREVRGLDESYRPVPLAHTP